MAISSDNNKQNIEPSKSGKPSMQQYAFAYLRKELKIFPCCWPIFENGAPRCDCGQSHSGRDIGKVPIGELCPHGRNDYTQTTLGVKSYWKNKYINANIGMVTDDYPTLDIDKSTGGYESLAKFEAIFGKLPETRTHGTGGGGEHRIYKQPKNKIISNAKSFQKEYPGLEIKGKGGYILMPPSLHKSGNRYFVKINIPAIEFPSSLIELINSQKAQSNFISTAEVEAIPQGGQDIWLFSRARGYRARGDTEDIIFQKLKLDIIRCPQNPAEPFTDADLHRIAKSAAKSAAKYSIGEQQFKTNESDFDKWMRSSGSY